MAFPARDIVTKQFDPGVFPITTSRIVDLQADPRGGYFALVDVPPILDNADAAYIVRLDGAHRQIESWAFNLVHLGEPGLNSVSVSAMSVSSRGIFVVGTIAPQRPGLRIEAFVAKLTLDGVYEWVRTYRPILLDGCVVPNRVHCLGRGIVRLAAPDDDRLLVLFQTSAISDGVAPPPEDSVAAAVFAIDDRGDVKSDVTRIFGHGQLMPTRLRLVPHFGPTIVGRTRVSHPLVEPWAGYLASFDRDARPVMETTYELIGADEMVLNDIAAENAEALILVGSTQTRGERRAVAMRIDTTVRTLWFADFIAPPGPPPIEFYSTELKVATVRDEVFIAGGTISSSQGLNRAWLVRLEAASPGLVWQKEYPVHNVRGNAMLIPSLRALLMTGRENVVAGGDALRLQAMGPRLVVDRIPFLAASETEPGFEEPRCSTETDARIGTRVLRQRTGPMWLDRMRIISVDGLPTWAKISMPETTLCGESQPPPG
jgi:hypothetical protein